MRHFILPLLILATLMGCDDKESLTFQDIEELEPIVTIEETTSIVHSFNGDEAVDTTGQAFSMGNGWYIIQNYVLDVDGITCSTSPNRVTYEYQGGVLANGGNFQEYSFRIRFKLDENGTNVTSFTNSLSYIVPGADQPWVYGSLCSMLPVTVDRISDGRIVGSFSGSVVRPRTVPFSATGTCEELEPELIRAEISGTFDLPMSNICN